MIVAVDDLVVGVIAVADDLRPDAARMVTELHRVGVQKVVMLTGDVHLVARAVGGATGIDEIHAGLLPEDKLNAVLEFQRDGHTVAMVGDGINDAPALATSNIGVAMGAAGSAVAIETADIALMGDNLLKLPEAISSARRTVANMRQNIIIAVGRSYSCSWAYCYAASRWRSACSLTKYRTSSSSSTPRDSCGVIVPSHHRHQARAPRLSMRLTKRSDLHRPMTNPHEEKP